VLHARIHAYTVTCTLPLAVAVRADVSRNVTGITSDKKNALLSDLKADTAWHRRKTANLGARLLYIYMAPSESVAALSIAPYVESGSRPYGGRC
jgi:hypothetical protein